MGRICLLGGVIVGILGVLGERRTGALEITAFTWEKVVVYEYIDSLSHRTGFCDLAITRAECL